MSNKSQLFRDRLKEPGPLSQLDVAMVRNYAKEKTEKQFLDWMSCSVEDAKQILSFWEIAQVELWDAEILKRFFPVWIYEDREIVSARIQAAIFAGRLTERVTPEAGLQWLESENIQNGWMMAWVGANAMQRPPQPPATTETPPVEASVQSGSVSERQDRRLKRLRELGGSVVSQGGNLRVNGIKELVDSEAAIGSYAKSEKTIRADVHAAFTREKASLRNGPFAWTGSR